MTTLRIACCQLDVLPGEADTNLRRMDELTSRASREGADLVVFPEVATSDYYVDDITSHADVIPGSQSAVVARMAQSTGTYVAAGLLEKTPAGVYNTAVLFSPAGDIIGTYRKTHLSVTSRNGTIPKESDTLLPGEKLEVFHAGFGVVGMMICKDGDYPEVPRALAVQGAEVILWMTNRGGVNRTASMHYAASNCAVLAACNRAAGHAKGGGSLVMDWQGNVLGEADTAEAVLLADFDLDALRESRENHWKIHRVRRPELYAPLVT
jgi:predicted amidohydrolase